MGIRAKRRDASWNPPSSGGDATGLFAVLVAVPLLLPVVVQLSFLLFALPLALLPLGATRAYAASRRREPRSGWLLLCAGVTCGALASVLGALAAAVPELERPTLYVGAAASAVLLASAVPFVRRALAAGGRTLVVDALLLDGVVVSLAVWFVVRPGLAHGDAFLTVVFAIDLIALALMTIAAAAAPTRGERRSGVALVGGLVAATVGDGVVATGGAEAVTAVLWGMAGLALLVATSDRCLADDLLEPPANRRFLLLRILLPVVAALSFPIAAGILAADGGLSRAAAIYLSTFFVATLALAFARQARLLLDNHKSAASERALRGEVVRRNRELEALTGLATTMTETLEEEPVVERGLSALRVAARPTSMALHVREGDQLVVQATAGEWGSEGFWALRDLEPGVSVSGGRQLVRLPLRVRGAEIGLVTLMRPADDQLGAEQVDLLHLLADQVAIAIQNARDYRDRLEQAIRDPLTGVYNRRFFYEAVGKELGRGERSGLSTSLVLIDVDDFKAINDSLGHSGGDDVLCAIARIAADVIRPADSFARVGGEEFALLLPETSQLDALLVAERVRRGVASAPILEGRPVTISAGVATFPDDARSLEELQVKADAALYWAKRNGKNLCAVATEVVLAGDGGACEEMLAHLHALVSTIDAEHLKTRDHSENVATYAAAIADALSLPPERIVRLRRAALFHDIGKIAVKAEILSKPAALTEEEYAEMKSHSVVGASMLAHSGFEEEARWVRQHHERVDGRGYPDGLGEREIALEARIIFVADSFEAMTSDRPYRAGMPVADAVAELRRCAGSQFDPRVVEALADLLTRDAMPVLALRD